MAKHEFGIMQTVPKASVRYDAYEPQKYNCISVEDDYVALIEPMLKEIDLFWHCVDMPGKGIAYCGITLIPPSAMNQIISVVQPVDVLTELKQLLQRAFQEDKWVIHFGL